MSTSAPVVGKAEHTRLPGAANAAIKLHADGTVPVGVAGTAGGISRDPGDIAPGLYDYRFDIDQLSLQTDDELDFAAVAFFGEDSRFVDPLWSLTVILDGLLSDITDLQIDFFSQPVLFLDDPLVEFNVLNAISVANGTATLSNFELFDTVYEVDQVITVGVGVEAVALSRAPEPGTWLLMGVGLIGYGWLKRHRVAGPV